MSKPMRQTPDSPRPHEAPPPHDNRKKRADFVALATAEREPALSTDEKELNKYLDAFLDRERVTSLSRFNLAYRALEASGPHDPRNVTSADIARQDAAFAEYMRVQGEILPEIPITTDAAGRQHLSPSWKAFDPELAREIRYQVRAIETARRFQTASTLQLPFDGIPARGNRPDPIVVPTPQYRGAKAGRRIVGAGRPTSTSVPTFYLPRQSELGDTLSESSSRDTKGRSQVVPETDQWEAINLCFDLARAVTERIVSVDALAEVILRLNAPISVRETCFRMLGHRDRKRLGKALRA